VPSVNASPALDRSKCLHSPPGQERGTGQTTRAPGASRVGSGSLVELTVVGEDGKVGVPIIDAGPVALHTLGETKVAGDAIPSVLLRWGDEEWVCQSGRLRSRFFSLAGKNAERRTQNPLPRSCNPLPRSCIVACPPSPSPPPLRPPDWRANGFSALGQDSR
jgi:hypothetical protein